MSDKERTVLNKGNFDTVKDSDVQYEFESPNQFFGLTQTMIPMANAVAAARNFYGHKFQTQAVPLTYGEAPYVQNLKDEQSNTSYQEDIGRYLGNVYADEDIEITKVTPDSIEYKNSKGEKGSKDLYNNFPYNRKTNLSNIPNVKVGDKVKAGSLLAHTNYTDKNGTINMGLNARVGLVPYKGWSIDDAVVISSDFAKKLTSEHTYQFTEDDNKDIKTGKDHYMSLFPKAFNRDQLDSIDENGIVKPGTIVTKGSPLILSTKPRLISSQDSALGRLSKYLKGTRADAAITWDKEDDGIVTDVIKGKNGYRVVVNNQSPAKVGDKLTQREGNKCYHPDTEVFTENGWKFISEITVNDKVAALFDKNQFQYNYTSKRIKQSQDLYAKFVNPLATTSYYYNGFLCGLEAPHAAYLVTPNHRVFSRANSRFNKDRSRWECRDAYEVHNMSRSFLTAAPFELNNRFRPTFIEIPYKPYQNKKLNEGLNNQYKFIPEDFVIFLAFYLAEGNVNHKDFNRDKSIVITQAKRPFTNGLEQLFSRMGFSYSYSQTSKQYTIYKQKSLAEYLHQFGKALNKFIPDEIKKLPIDLLQLFLATYMQGDGNKSIANTIYTSSKRMAEDISEIIIMCGYNVTLHIRDRRNKKYFYEKRNCEINRNAPEYIVSVLNTNIALTRKVYKKAYYQSSYSGYVYCCQVPGLGVILTRLHGKIMWNGNSTISQIIPVDQMPRTKDGRPLDILINDLSIPSRQNAALMYEILLGKIAEKTGKIYKLPTFQTDKEGKWYDFVQKELDKNGLTDVEEVYDPVLDRTLEKPITVGNVYVQKLHHMGESKLSARGQGIYDNNLMPSKGGGEAQQSKRLSGLETSALLSAGAYNVIKDANSLRGQKNDDYWRAVREGKTPSLVNEKPFVWNKLMALMQGAGVQATDKGNGKLRLAPFTDKGLAKLNPSELTNGEIVSLKDLKPVKGGLFDPTMSLTNKWGKITLDEPIINPPFENHVAALLGIKKSDIESIIKGEKDLDKFGTGSNAIKKALSNIDMKAMFNEAYKDFKEGPKTGKQKALNRMNYIKGLLRNDLKPEDLMISAIPVIPSAFRPYAVMGDTFLPGDVNELYKEVFNVNQAQKELKAELGENLARENSIHLYRAVKSLYGLEEPENKKLKQRDISGFMQKLVGGTAKFSYPQRVLNSKNVDFSGRSVIDPNPELDMDEIGIPYDIGWKIFAPYIQRDLVKHGMSATDAIKEIENKSDKAKAAMERVADTQRVLYSRAPAWHKYNLLGGKAKFHDGKAILINPLVASGLNADYDGDAQWGFVYMLTKI